MEKIFEIATNISTPLMLAGFLAAAFFFTIRLMISKGLFPQINKQGSGDILKIIINRLFILALIAMVLGFIGYILDKSEVKNEVKEEGKEYYAPPSIDLVKMALQEISAIDLAPKPELKNLIISFKVIPGSKDKFAPLMDKGDFILIDSNNVEKLYSFNVNIPTEGIKPQVISYISFDGLIPRNDFKNILQCNNYRGKCVVYYDRDIVKTDQAYQSEIFPLTKSNIEDLSAGSNLQSGPIIVDDIERLKIEILSIENKAGSCSSGKEEFYYLIRAGNEIIDQVDSLNHIVMDEGETINIGRSKVIKVLKGGSVDLLFEFWERDKGADDFFTKEQVVRYKYRSWPIGIHKVSVKGGMDKCEVWVTYRITMV